MPQPRGAAFFDLDRTLLAGGSGPIIGEAFRRVGLLSDRSKGLESLAFRMFDLVGETYPSMLITRQGARAASGWSVELVEKAAELAAEPLRRAVLPYAHHLFDEHREAGRPLVLATTTPVTLVAPLAAALGFDDVIATTYGEQDGRFDGTIDGEFVWGKGKARAVAEWAGAHDVDLDQSFAYSDSYYDVPLLSMVGHPRAVNPDPRMLAMATLRRWPVLHLDVPDGIPKLVGVEPQQVLFQLARPQFMPWVRIRTAGVEKLPRNGAAVLVGNHRSYFDPL
ncbi:MAG: HAD-IB family hydrolase, partial [Actinomycetes bacterium]